MGLLDQVKENLGKEEEEEKKKVLLKRDKTFNLFDVEFEKYQNMDKVKEGHFELIPTACALTHYLLVNGGQGYYCGLEDNNTGNLFEIYEYDVGEEEPNLRAYDLNMDGKMHLKFLVEKIGEGFDVYLQK